ncbi:MAG TPA: hypothetical protein VMU22_00630 [Rhizomicrobium sp.]|nr:hypothetical protein [Rhizomicrobium sp.]
MKRLARWSAFAAVAAFAMAGNAYAADDDELKTLIADCSGANVKLDDVDSCLERARVLGEESPSPELQGLTARLERMAEQGEDNSDLSKAYSVTPARTAEGGGGTGTVASGSIAAPHGNMH